MVFIALLVLFSCITISVSKIHYLDFIKSFKSIFESTGSAGRGWHFILSLFIIIILNYSFLALTYYSDSLF